MLQQGSRKIVKAEPLLVDKSRTRSSIDATNSKEKQSLACFSSDSIMEANLKGDLSTKDAPGAVFSRSNTIGRGVLYLEEDNRMANM